MRNIFRKVLAIAFLIIFVVFAQWVYNLTQEELTEWPKEIRIDSINFKYTNLSQEHPSIWPMESMWWELVESRVDIPIPTVKQWISYRTLRQVIGEPIRYEFHIEVYDYQDERDVEKAKQIISSWVKTYSNNIFEELRIDGINVSSISDINQDLRFNEFSIIKTNTKLYLIGSITDMVGVKIIHINFITELSKKGVFV